ncbi:hypothetical protein BDV96DRAFT_567139, partial [Lophiotrema nucula]
MERVLKWRCALLTVLFFALCAIVGTLRFDSDSDRMFGQLFPAGVALFAGMWHHYLLGPDTLQSRTYARQFTRQGRSITSMF